MIEEKLCCSRRSFKTNVSSCLKGIKIFLETWQQSHLALLFPRRVLRYHMTPSVFQKLEVQFLYKKIEIPFLKTVGLIRYWKILISSGYKECSQIPYKVAAHACGSAVELTNSEIVRNFLPENISLSYDSVYFRKMGLPVFGKRDHINMPTLLLVFLWKCWREADWFSLCLRNFLLHAHDISTSLLTLLTLLVWCLPYTEMRALSFRRDSFTMHARATEFILSIREALSSFCSVSFSLLLHVLCYLIQILSNEPLHINRNKLFHFVVLLTLCFWSGVQLIEHPVKSFLGWIVRSAVPARNK